MKRHSHRACSRIPPTSPAYGAWSVLASYRTDPRSLRATWKASVRPWQRDRRYCRASPNGRRASAQLRTGPRQVRIGQSTGHAVDRWGDLGTDPDRGGPHHCRLRKRLTVDRAGMLDAWKRPLKHKNGLASGYVPARPTVFTLRDSESGQRRLYARLCACMSLCDVLVSFPYRRTTSFMRSTASAANARFSRMACSSC